MNYVDLNDPIQAGMYYANLAKHAVKQTLVSNHPELLNVEGPDDIRNEETITRVMEEHGWPWTPENIEAAFCVAKENGQLNLPMYSAAEVAAFPRMTTAEIREHLERRYEPAAPMNAAEFLMTAGGRAKDTILNKEIK
jgi:hypothetical protein